ncbi:MAG: pentapeptide repeat-containing protein [Solirubrobacteraceae bacterium]
MAEAAPTVVGEYRNAANAIRENAKWGLKSLGGVAAALIAGLGLSSLAKVHSTSYLALALVGMTVALMGVGWLFYTTASILKPSTVSASSLVVTETYSPPSYLSSMLDSEALLKGLALNVEQLVEKTRSAEADYAKALLDNFKERTEASALNAEAAEHRAELYEQTVRAIEAQAAYLEIANRVHAVRQMLAGAIVAAGVGIFAVALALPTDPPPDFHGANLTGTDLAGTSLVASNFKGLKLKSVDLSQANLRKANFDGADLNEVNLIGADVKDASFKGAHWLNTVCPDGANSANAGQTCEQHLEARTNVATPSTTKTVSARPTGSAKRPPR